MAVVNQLEKLHERISNSKLWQTHSHRMLYLFFFVLTSAFVILLFGLSIFWSLNTSYNIDYLAYISTAGDENVNFPNPVISLCEQRSFELPTSYMEQTIPVTFNFVLSSDSYFVQNTLFEMNISATANKNDLKANGISILSIETKQFNATDVYPDEYLPLGYREQSYSSYYSGETYLYVSQQETEYVWNNVDFFTFHNNGSLACNVTIYLSRNYSNSSLQEEIDSYLTSENKTFQNEVVFTHHFANFSVKSYLELTESEKNDLHSMMVQRQQSSQLRFQEIQTAILHQSQVNQENNEQQNIAFSCVVIFLALIEISFIIYENSEDEERKEQYRYKKRYKKYEEQKQNYAF